MSGYISNTGEQQREMLAQSGLENKESLFKDIPQHLRLMKELNLQAGMSEIELFEHMKDLARKNHNLEDYTCFLGAGAYDHFIPSVVDHMISRQEFYTAYTPYQPEISQGTLQAIFEYQTMICELTGMEVANASLYDGATALAEAVAMACQTTKRKEVLIANTVHPESREVLKTYSRGSGNRVSEINYREGRMDMGELETKISCDTAAVILQTPNFFGMLENVQEAVTIAHRNKSLFIVSVDPVSLGILKAPGELDADIVVGEGQALGNSISFGGPYLGFFATTKSLMRKIPGRIVGQTTDYTGKRGYVLTLQAREQHIRREKAISNICSNEALNALAATVHLSMLGKQGFKTVAELCLQKAHYAYNQLIQTGKFKPVFSAPFFKEFIVKSAEPIEQLNKKLLEEKIIGGFDIGRKYPELKNCWLIAVTEKRSKTDIDRLIRKAIEA